MICEFCGSDPDLIIDPAITYSEEVIAEYKEAGLNIPQPHKQGHNCHCHREVIEVDGEMVKMRTAWGICCAKFEVGAGLMAEEDFHDKMPWSEKSDCKC